MRMRKGSTSSFWNKFNRQQNDLAVTCMPRLQNKAEKAVTYPEKRRSSGSFHVHGSLTPTMIPSMYNVGRTWSY